MELPLPLPLPRLLFNGGGGGAEVSEQREVSLNGNGVRGDESQGPGLVAGFEQARHARQVADRVVELGRAFDEVAVDDLGAGDGGGDGGAVFAGGFVA